MNWTALTIILALAIVLTGCSNSQRQPKTAHWKIYLDCTGVLTVDENNYEIPPEILSCHNEGVWL